MSFLRSPAVFGNVLQNIQFRASYFIRRHVAFNPAFSSTVTRSFSKSTETVPKTVSSLDTQLKYMEDFSRRGRFIAREYTDELLQSISRQQATSPQIVRAFQFCGELLVEETPQERAKLTQGLWKTLQSKYVIDISHYNAFLAVNVQNEQPISLEDTLADLKSRNLIPNRATYQNIIDSYSRQGDLNGLARTMEAMQNEKISLNNTMYNSMILAYGLAGEKERSLELAAIMKEAGFNPTRETQTTILRVHARYGDIAAILTEIGRLKTKMIVVNDRHILDLVYDLAVNGHGPCCIQLFDEFAKDGSFVRLASNTVIRLVQKGQDDVAVKLLKIIPRRKSESGEVLESGGFLLRQLIKVDRPLEKITEICKELQEEGIHSSPFRIVLPRLRDSGPSDLIWSVFRERKARGEALVEDDFRVLFKSKSVAEIQQYLRIMIEEFGIQPSGKFIRLVVLPSFDGQKTEQILSSLLAARVQPSQASLSVMYECLLHDQLKDAANVGSYFRLHFPIKAFKPLIISALQSTNDIKSYVQLLRVHFENARKTKEEWKYEKIVDSEVSAGPDVKSINNNEPNNWGSMLIDTLAAFAPTERGKISPSILSELVEQGLTISREEVEQMRKEIEPSVNNNALLDQLVSGKLELKPIPMSTLRIRSSSLRLEKLLSNGRARDTDDVRTRLLDAYYHEGETKKFDQCILQFEHENVSIPDLMYSRLIDMKVEAKDLIAVREIFRKCKASNNEFYLFPQTVIRAVSAFIENGEFDEAIKFAAETCRSTDSQRRPAYDYESQDLCQRLLNRLADEGRDRELNQLFECLVQNGHVKVTNKLLGPLVRVHLVNNNSKKAVQTFEELAQQYKETPVKNALFKYLVVNGELEGLQKVVDISSAVHNEHNVLTELAIISIECDKIQQAQSIFAMPELRPNRHVIKNISAKYNQEGNIEFLENLANVTKVSRAIDREEIFLNLLDYYIREDNSVKALALFNNIKTPSESVRNKLGAYLKHKQINVPFELSSAEENIEKEDKNDKVDEKVYNFIGLIDRKSAPEIEIAFQQLNKPALTGVIRKIGMESQRLMKLFDILAEAGNIDGVETVNSLLPKQQQDRIWYRDSRAKAYGLSGQARQWIDEWNKKLEYASTKELVGWKRFFPLDGFYSLLKSNPQLITECEALALKCADQMVFGPINVIWCHQFIERNKEASDRLWEEFIKNSSFFFYQPITNEALKNNDCALVIDLISCLQTTETGKNQLDRAQRCLLNIYINNNELDDALRIADLLRTNGTDISRQTLTKLLMALKAAGREVPHEIEKDVQMKSKWLNNKKYNYKTNDDRGAH